MRKPRSRAATATLDGFVQLTDAGLARLADMPLTRLNMYRCRTITDAGFAHLAKMPIKRMDLTGCERLTDAGLAHFSGMPLTDLCLRFCGNVTSAGIERAGLSAVRRYKPLDVS